MHGGGPVCHLGPMGEEMAQPTWSHFPESSAVGRFCCSLGTGNSLGVAILKDNPLALLLDPCLSCCPCVSQLQLTVAYSQPLVMGLLKL